MRITNSQSTAILLDSMSRNTEKMSQLMQQMSSSNRIQHPSDDPIAAVRILRIQRSEASLAQYGSNIAGVSGNLSIQETNLQSTSDTLLDIRDLLLWAANGSNANEQLGAMAGELSNLEKTLVSYLNVKDEEGRYLFSGTLTDQPAVTYDEASGTYSATGNDKTRQAVVANGVMVDENVAIRPLFGNGMDLLNGLHALVAKLQDPALDSSDPAIQQSIAATLDLLDDSHGKLLSAITDLGGRQNTLTLLDNSNQDISLVNQKVEGDLSALDYAKASIDLGNYKLALQATQKTYLTVNGLSLFSLL
ncbi:flagellar hook-associated protein FlgL [Pseudomonas sp. R3.Fl]|uniref:flagellar hook-associated protein FlgL n=1 Tax=Pseudomonas TaxID=286 RepID=UPI00201DEA2C|nr:MULTISPECIES: flagellar hook-associated protein FlgL [Pseudomonas]MCL6687586.1 flagellar hook-associated protein FlgL [Pseudomonas sp. R3.Fl]MCP1603788.1 flagellar hook-associated protein 3 FlgL [Pseudomonas citronellolis]MCP1640533.1 flagellar hook-associated protein 3 FlgL [Pseudomonas citronellolis]MCP1657945.1 flagellar hook-associated protein 3 FlgL [Pseudomonas citronellolis]MCP1663453.1 flagellar hook-associated protein 3 FlgL [Pseudomonas citronellolis]